MFFCRKCSDTMTEADRQLWSQMAQKQPQLKCRLECPACEKKTLLGKVVAIVQLKRRLPLSHKHLLNVSGTFYQSFESLKHRLTQEGALSYGEVVYMAGSKLLPKLRFLVKHPSGEIELQHYEPGDWEDKADLAYAEVNKVLAIAETLERAGEKQDQAMWQNAIKDLGSFPVGQGLLLKHSDGVGKAQAGKLSCPVCKTKIRESDLLTPVHPPVCPQCGYLVEW